MNTGTPHRTADSRVDSTRSALKSSTLALALPSTTHHLVLRDELSVTIYSAFFQIAFLKPCERCPRLQRAGCLPVSRSSVQMRFALRAAVEHGLLRQSRRFSSNWAENRTFLSKVLQQSFDFRKCYFNPRVVLPCGLDAVAPAVDQVASEKLTPL